MISNEQIALALAKQIPPAVELSKRENREVSFRMFRSETEFSFTENTLGTDSSVEYSNLRDIIKQWPAIGKPTARLAMFHTHPHSIAMFSFTDFVLSLDESVEWLPQRFRTIFIISDFSDNLFFWKWKCAPSYLKKLQNFFEDVYNDLHKKASVMYHIAHPASVRISFLTPIEEILKLLSIDVLKTMRSRHETAYEDLLKFIQL